MKILVLLILTLLLTIGVKAQPWIVPASGNIYYNQGNVGIGTTNPVDKFHVSGGDIGIDQPYAFKFANGQTIRDNGGGGLAITSVNSINNTVANGSYYTISGGNVGIGMNNPNSKVVISDGYGTMSIGSGGTSGGIGFNRNVKDGQIFNTAVSAWQFQTRDDRFTLEGYNGAAHDLFTVLKNGDVGMGTIAPQYKLDVIGTIRAKEIKVDLNGADFVFGKEYKLMPLSELETFINEQKHLPDIAPAKEMHEKGTNLGDLNSKLLQKVEELTLYVIVQNTSLKEQAKKNEEQAIKLEALEKAVNILISRQYETSAFTKQKQW